MIAELKTVEPDWDDECEVVGDDMDHCNTHNQSLAICADNGNSTSSS